MLTHKTAGTVKLASTLLLAAAVPEAALAGPTDGVVRAGAATIATSGVATTVNQTSDRAVIDWRSFNIAAGESVSFSQPTSQSAILNRVIGTQVSSLQGALTANGQVYLLNPNGVLIGNGATIDAASFVATTANIGNDTFMASPASLNGRYAFDQVTLASGSGTIVNGGTITAADGGLIALVAPAVRNSGTVAARLGKVTLASANIFTLDLFGDDLVRLAISDQIANALTDTSGAPVTAQVNVSGQVRADGGRVALLSVPAAAGIVDSAINLSGVARAHTAAAGKEGQILLLAAGDVKISGNVDATAAGAGLSGGTIEAFGANLRVLAPAHIDASGAGGGGLVAIGGRLTLGGTTSENATADVAVGASLAACGTVSCTDDGTGGTGKGGTVRLYSSNGTTLAGKVDVSSAEGSVAGTVEVLSNLGLTTLGPQSQIFAHTGTGREAGFAVVIGDELSIAPTVSIDMRDFAGTANITAARRLYDNDNPPERAYIRGNDPAQTFLQTTDPVLFHAYNPDAQGPVDPYTSHLPARADPNDGFEAEGYTTPVGTLRPNGGAPTTLGSASSDALVAIPVSFTAPDASNPGGGSSSPPGAPGSPGSAFGQVADANSRVTRTETAGNDEALHPATTETALDSGSLPLVVGGPGVAQIADLGRNAGVSGPAPNVFGVNFHVVAPAGGEVDAPVTDYLCKTPFAHNGCLHPPASAPAH